MRAVSLARRREQKDRARVRNLVFARDGWACQFPHHLFPNAPVCWPRMIGPHHRRKSGQGGGYTLDNLVSCCHPANNWIEDAVGADRQLLVELDWIILHRATA